MGTEVEPIDTKVIINQRTNDIIRRLNKRSHILENSMNLEKSITCTEPYVES